MSNVFSKFFKLFSTIFLKHFSRHNPPQNTLLPLHTTTLGHHHCTKRILTICRKSSQTKRSLRFWTKKTRQNRICIFTTNRLYPNTLPFNNSPTSRFYQNIFSFKSKPKAVFPKCIILQTQNHKSHSTKHITFQKQPYKSPITKPI